jgi:16S rRNA (cytosine1402-N4)-methyltransferase
MVVEVLEALKPVPDGRYVDGTLGLGGHAEAILRASAPNGWLFGCDRDGDALRVATERLAEFTGRIKLVQANYAELRRHVEAGSCDGVLLDLGVSSLQLESARRGFSFQWDGPLDMRMDGTQGRTAADLVNEAGVDELTSIFRGLGEEPQARRLARAIEIERQNCRFETTRQLAQLVERISPRRGRRTHPATRIFQALRMAVNDELEGLRRGLNTSVDLLKPGGRLVVVTFHSVEDRVVKEFGREQSRAYAVPGGVDIPELRQPVQPRAKWVCRKAILPTPREIAGNPRSRSAQLRALEKI